AIEDRERVFSMKKENSMDADDFVPYYTAEDLEVIRQVGTIENVVPVSSSLLGDGTTEELIDGEHLVFTDITTASNEAMQLMGVDDFTFSEGQPVPIVIGIEALKQYKDILQVNDETSSEKKAELLSDYQHTTSFTTTYSNREKIKEVNG